MPAKSKAQLGLMYATLDNPELAKRKGISRKVAKDFVEATHSTKGLPAHVKKKRK